MSISTFVPRVPRSARRGAERVAACAVLTAVLVITGVALAVTSGGPPLALAAAPPLVVSLVSAVFALLTVVLVVGVLAASAGLVVLLMVRPSRGTR